MSKESIIYVFGYPIHFFVVFVLVLVFGILGVYISNNKIKNRIIKSGIFLVSIFAFIVVLLSSLYIRNFISISDEILCKDSVFAVREISSSASRSRFFVEKIDRFLFVEYAERVYATYSDRLYLTTDNVMLKVRAKGYFGPIIHEVKCE